MIHGAQHKLKPGPSVRTHSGTPQLSGPEVIPPYSMLKEPIGVSSNPSLMFTLVPIEFEFQHLTMDKPLQFNIFWSMPFSVLEMLRMMRSMLSCVASFQESRTYSSADSIQGAEDGAQYPVEYLNSINTGGLPPSQVEVKIGVPLMLPRNLDPGLGLCNGTQLRLMQMTNRVLHVKIISGPYAGEMVFIPMIKLISSEELPFELHRVQFQVMLAYGITINKE